VLRTLFKSIVALYRQLGCAQLYNTEAGVVDSLVRVKSPAVKIYALVFGISALDSVELLL
jgi:hypothetical protein